MTRHVSLWALFACLSAAQEQPGAFNTALERAAIERLHVRDAAAAKKGDADALAALWSDDAVALPPGEQPVIGIAAIRKWLAKSQGSAPAVEIIDYVLDFQEVTILGDRAIEWGRTSVVFRPSGTSSVLRASGNLLRVLKKQADGSWKVSRSAWNLERPVPAKP